MDGPGQEVGIEQAREIAESGRGRLVWIGREPSAYIAELLGVDASLVSRLDPSAIASADGATLKSLSGAVLVCYHGVSSLRAVRFLERNGVRAHSLRGGVTSIVGEIF